LRCVKTEPGAWLLIQADAAAYSNRYTRNNQKHF
jgi:hypothetical protein